MIVSNRIIPAVVHRVNCCKGLACPLGGYLCDTVQLLPEPLPGHTWPVLLQCLTVPVHCPVLDRWPSSSPPGEWQQLALAKLPAKVAAHKLGPL